MNTRKEEGPTDEELWAEVRRQKARENNKFFLDSIMRDVMIPCGFPREMKYYEGSATKAGKQILFIN